MADHKKYKKITVNFSTSIIQEKIKSPLLPIERFDPSKTPWYSRKLLQEHLTRYLFAAGYVQGKTVIELGCGLGYGCKIIAYKGAKKVFGIDIDQKAIDFARKNYSDNKIHYLIKDATNTRLPSGVADIIICFETIEHLKKPEKLLKEITRLLKPRGLLILSTPNKQTSLGINPFHLREFSFMELDQLLNRFKINEYYGQGKAFLPITKLYQELVKKYPSAIIKKISQLKPWEGFSIYPINKQSSNNSVYFIAVCRK